jgi:hypothetical protein
LFMVGYYRRVKPMSKSSTKFFMLGFVDSARQIVHHRDGNECAAPFDR